MIGVISADWHLRRDVPRCRFQSPEEWLETQRQQVHFVINQAKKRLCPLYICGDVFDSPVVHPIISNMLEEELKEQETYIIAGNHDLPWHNPDLLHQASIFPFVNVPAGGAHFGQPFDEKEIMFIHTLVFPDEKSRPPHAGGQTAKELMEEHPQAVFIFTGDNHRSFTKKIGNQWLINPGSLNRQAADQIDYEPICYFVDTANKIVEALYIPDPVELVTDSYLKTEAEREGRIEAFIEKIQSKETVTLDFRANLKARLKEPAVKPIIPVIEKIAAKAGVIL